jgi:SAM-dependent methyltransferase
MSIVTKELIEKVNAFYNDLEFPGRYSVEDLDYYSDEISNVYLKFMDQYLADGLSILDVGCGTGLITNVFANRYKSSFTAIDFSKGVLYGKEYAEKNKILNTQWLHQNFLDYTTDTKYDVIICQGVLHHIPEHKRGLANMKTLLKPGGVLLLGLYHPVGKLAQKIIKLNFFNDLLQTDQMSNPFELSFTCGQVENMCKPLVLESYTPELFLSLTNPTFFQSGGLVIYSLRNQT